MGQVNRTPANFSRRINLPRVYGFTDLIRYTFRGRQIERWQLDLPDDNPNSEKLVIGEQSIHQMVVTEKYIILADIAFKIEYSQLFSPFHIGLIENCIDNLLKCLKWLIDRIFPEMTNCIKILWEKISGKIFRTGYWLYAWLLKPLTPSQITNFYIVRRSDLDTIHSTRETRPGSSNVVSVRKVTIPREVSHFTADYSNPGDDDNLDDGKITLHVGHNHGTDVTEWISKYDTPVGGKLSGVSERNFQRLAGMTTGAVDVSSFGRYVVDGESGALLDSKIFSDVEHTWWPSVYTHRDICRDSPQEAGTTEIKNMFWMCWGFSWEIVPERIYQIYKDRDFRVIHQTGLPETGKPCKLLRLDTETMEIIDWFDFPRRHFACSPQFIPKTPPSPNGKDPSIQGYIACVVLADMPDNKAGTPEAKPKDEIWIFDAENLGNVEGSNEPAVVYKLSSKTKPLNLGLMIHSIWLSSEDFKQKSEPYLEPNKRKNLRENAFWRDYGTLLPQGAMPAIPIDMPRALRGVGRNPKIRQLFQTIKPLFIEQTLEIDIITNS